MSEVHEGGCLCGQIRLRLAGTPHCSIVCHCRSCRLGAGAAGVGWITVAGEAFTITAGEPVRYRSSPKVTRSFCGTCGTSLTYAHDDDDTLDVTTASMDQPERFPPEREVWLDDKLSWEVLDDRLPQYSRGSGEAPVHDPG